MAYTIPTAAELRARFPELKDVSGPRMTAIISEASRNVDESWLEEDYKTAIMYLAAHMIVMEDAANGGANAALGRGPIRSMSLGRASETYASPGGDAMSMSSLGMTVYGSRYLQLRYVNVGGTRTVY